MVYRCHMSPTILVFFTLIHFCFMIYKDKDSLRVLWELKSQNYVPQNELFTSFESFQRGKRSMEAEFSGRAAENANYDDQDLCLNCTFEAVAVLDANSILAFRGEYHWIFSIDYGIYPQYPKKNGEGFKGVTAAVKRGDDNILIFRENNKVVRYKFERNEQEGFKFTEAPKDANTKEEDWSLKVKSGTITGAFEGFQTEFYLITDKQTLWTVSESDVISSTDEYKGILKEVDSAYRNQLGHIYMFTGEDYSRIDNNTKKVPTNLKPKYPRKTALWFIFCRNALSVSGASNLASFPFLVFVISIYFVLKQLA